MTPLQPVSTLVVEDYRDVDKDLIQEYRGRIYVLMVKQCRHGGGLFDWCKGCIFKSTSTRHGSRECGQPRILPQHHISAVQHLRERAYRPLFCVPILILVVRIPRSTITTCTPIGGIIPYVVGLQVEQSNTI